MYCSTMHGTVILSVLLVSIIHSVPCHTLDDDTIKTLIDDFVEYAMQCSNIPGLTLSVVKDNQDFIAKGYGVRNLTQLEPVTNETLFLLASVTKAFTGVTAAIVIRNEESGENRLNWRTPIRNFLQSVGEDFYFNDTLRSQLVNLRDLFGHRTGISFNNPIRIYGYDIDEAMHRLQYLQIVNDFRDDYVFNNLMFGLAAWVMEKAEGRLWEEITRDELLLPLGMTSSTFIKDESRWDEFATGHYIDEETGQPRGVSLDITNAYFEAFSAAGSIGSNAIDMLQWIKFQLDGGVTEDGVEILSPAQFEVTHTPSMQKLAPPRWERPSDPVTYKFGTHSVAWSEHTYRDYRISQHIGGETGFQSLISIGRSMGFGIFTGINKDPHQGAMDYIHMYIMDLLLGEEPWLNKTDICDEMMHRKESDSSCDVCQYDYDALDTIKSNIKPKSSGISSRRSERFLKETQLPNKAKHAYHNKNIKMKAKYGMKNSDKIGNAIQKLPASKTWKNKENIYQSQELIKDVSHNEGFGFDLHHLILNNFTGCYGHYAYGNITIELNDTSDQLYMVYGLDGKYEWTWDLVPIDEELSEFQGSGRDAIWYYKVVVVFDTDTDSTTGEDYVAHLYVDFDREIPPRFDRDLDWNNPPPPPPICLP